MTPLYLLGSVLSLWTVPTFAFPLAQMLPKITIQQQTGITTSATMTILPSASPTTTGLTHGKRNSSLQSISVVYVLADERAHAMQPRGDSGDGVAVARFIVFNRLDVTENSPSVSTSSIVTLSTLPSTRDDTS